MADRQARICAGLYRPVYEVAHHFRETHGLEVKTDILIPEPFETSTKVSKAVYRILTESLNNIVKHAGTMQAQVQLYQQNGYLILTVMDNGIGSGLPELSLSELTRLHHLGVRGMVEWGKMVEGQLRIKANQPTGTTVQLEIPLVV